MPARVLFLALDACDVEEATSLARAGTMPVLADLLATARRIPTLAPPGGTYVSANWPTITTGVSPARHGYTCWKTIDPTTGEERPTSPKDVEFDPFWVHLSDRGRRIALLDVPHTWPAEGLNGVMLCEWAGHDRHFGLGSWPPSLASEVVEQFGVQPIAMLEHDTKRQFAPCDWVHGGPWGARSLDQAAALHDDILDGLERKRAASLHYLASEDWDLFATVFGEAHCTGHQFWYLHDEEHDRFDPEHAAVLGDPVAEIYARLDAVVGEHLAAVDDHTDTLVFLSHGMSAHYTGEHLFDTVLARLAAADDTGGRSRVIVRSVKRAWSALPLTVRRRLHPLVARLVRRRARESTAPSGIGDASSPRSAVPFYPFPNNDPVGAVRINLAEREAHGIVAPDEYDAVCDRLALDLLDLVNVETGQPAVARIQRGIDLFGDGSASGADLYVDWNWAHPLEVVYSPKIGLVRAPYRHVRTGDHRPHGLLLARGPSFVPGAPLGRVGVEDVAPTIAALLGVELPDVDGQPISAIANARVDTRP
jgi:predicted AlkP superfamily phosphohydrolase/phosphomutase